MLDNTMQLEKDLASIGDVLVMRQAALELAFQTQNVRLYTAATSCNDQVIVEVLGSLIQERQASLERLKHVFDAEPPAGLSGVLHAANVAALMHSIGELQILQDLAQKVINADGEDGFPPTKRTTQELMGTAIEIKQRQRTASR